jgi:predicted TIM-barrel fold metal-dependent hydrolase
VAFGLIWAIWGAISGIVYGVSLSVTQRGRMLGQLQARHLAFWGALAGASYPGFIWVSSLLSPNSVWLSDLPLATALGAVAGAASACGSLWIAKRAEARVLLQPPPAVETPTAQSRELHKVLVIAGCILPATLSAQAPIIDYHQHLFSKDAAVLVTGNEGSPALDARGLIALLDSAGIRHALVLSMGYTWGKASRATVDDEYNHVKAENDWTAQQVAQFPDRLRAFCSVNPLKSYALGELKRCSEIPQLRSGLKLHFGNSDVDLDNAQNVAQARMVFQAANSLRMAIVVHMRTSLDMRRRYGADAARVFLNELLPAAPDVPVQVAHLAGSGGYNSTTDSALSVFTDAIACGVPSVPFTLVTSNKSWLVPPTTRLKMKSVSLNAGAL